MTRRRWLLVLLPVAIVVLALGAHAAWWYSGAPLGEHGFLLVPGPGRGVEVEINVENRSEGATPSFDITLLEGTETVTVPVLAPGESVALVFRQTRAEGEQSLVAVDAQSRTYELVGYFEGSLGGRIDLRLSAVRSDGELVGVHRDRVSYFGSDDWSPFGAVSE